MFRIISKSSMVAVLLTMLSSLSFATTAKVGTVKFVRGASGQVKLPVSFIVPKDHAPIQFFTILVQYDTSELTFNSGKSEKVLSAMNDFNAADNTIQLSYSVTSGGIDAATNDIVANLAFDVLTPDKETANAADLPVSILFTSANTSENGGVDLINVFTAKADTKSTVEEDVVNVDVLANDQHFDSSGNELAGASKYPVTITAVPNASSVDGAEKIEIVSNQIRVTPTLDYNGDINFNYTATADASSASAGNIASTAAVTVTVTPVNDRPTLTAVTPQTIPEDHEHEITLAMLNDENDVDNDNSKLTVVLTDGDNYSVNGTKVIPDRDFVGKLTVPVAVSDGQLTSSPAVDMVVTVTPVNDRPTLTMVTAQTVAEEGELEITLAMLNDENDVDNDNSKLTVVLTDGDDYSVVGTKITPDKDFVGKLTVPVAVSDGTLTSSPAINMTVTVTNVNDRPVLTKVTNQIGDKAIDEDSSLTITLDMLNDESDVDGDALTVVLTDGSNYSVSGATVTPDKDYHGNISVPVAVSDGSLASTPAVNMTIAVKPVNDAPVFATKTITPPKDLLNPAKITVNAVASNTNEGSETYTYKYVWKSADKVVKTVDFSSATSSELSVADQTGASLSGNYPISCVVTAKDNGKSGSPLANDFKESDVTLNTYVGNEPPKIVEEGTTPAGNKAVNEKASIVFNAKFDDSSSSPSDDGIKSVKWFVEQDGKYTEVQDNKVTSVSGPVEDQFTFTPNNNVQLHNNSKVVKVKVEGTDGVGSARERVWIVNVTDVNTKPLLNATKIVVSPAAPKTDNSLKATITPLATDADKEDQDSSKNPKVDNLKYVVTWYDAANTKVAVHTETLPVGDAYVSTLDKSKTNKNKSYVAKVRVKDTVDLFADDSSSASVLVINTAPVLKSPAVDIDQNANEDTVATYVASTLTNAFSDADKDNLSVSSVKVKDGSKGVVSVNSGGDVVFDPNKQFENLDDTESASSTIQMVVTDGDSANEGTGSKEFTVTVRGANDAPVINAVKLIARDSSDKEVSVSKPDQIVKFIAQVSASDLDNNDATLDTKDVKFTLIRKDDKSSPYQFTASSVNFDKNAAGEVTVTPADLKVAKFMKDDKLSVVVTVNDKTADSVSRAKRITIGNPPWFPVVELAGFVDGKVALNGTYRVVYTEKASGKDVAVVDTTIDSEKTEVLPIDYINGSWEYPVAGLKKSTTYVISSITKYNKATMSYDEDVAVDSDTEIVVDDYDFAVAEDPSGVDDINPGVTPSLESVKYNNQYTNTFAFTTDLSDVSGYTYTLTSDTGVNKSKTVFLMPDSDGAISTGDTFVITETLTEDGSYTFTMTPINPETLNAPVESVVTATFDFVAANYVDPATDSNVNPEIPTSSDFWLAMTPGGGIDYYDKDGDGQNKDPQNVGSVDEGGSKKVTFSWPAVPWASNYLIYLATADGQDVPGLGRIPATDTTVDITLKPGLYQWYVIARNPNGYSEQWSDVAWFIIDTTGGSTLPSVSGATVSLVTDTDELFISGITNATTVQVYIIKDGSPFAFVSGLKVGSNGNLSTTLDKDVTTGSYEVYINAFGADNVSSGYQVPKSTTVVKVPPSPVNP